MVKKCSSNDLEKDKNCTEQKKKKKKSLKKKNIEIEIIYSAMPEYCANQIYVSIAYLINYK